MRSTTTLASLFVCSMSGVAAAQMPPPADTPVSNDPAPPPPPVEATPPAGTTPTAPVTEPPPARDDTGNLGSAIGVGVQATLAGPAGPALVYNGGRFHIEGILAFADIDKATAIGLAGRAWFHVHDSPGASLSVGG